MRKTNRFLLAYLVQRVEIGLAFDEKAHGTELSELSSRVESGPVVLNRIESSLSCLVTTHIKRVFARPAQKRNEQQLTYVEVGCVDPCAEAQNELHRLRVTLHRGAA